MRHPRAPKEFGGRGTTEFRRLRRDSTHEGRRGSSVLRVEAWLSRAEIILERLLRGDEVQRSDPAIHPRVRKSLIVTENMIRSQKNPEATTSHVNRVPQRTCMKNRMTSRALVTAIANMTTLLKGPMSMRAAA